MAIGKTIRTIKVRTNDDFLKWYGSHKLTVEHDDQALYLGSIDDFYTLFSFYKTLRGDIKNLPEIESYSYKGAEMQSVFDELIKSEDKFAIMKYCLTHKRCAGGIFHTVSEEIGDKGRTCEYKYLQITVVQMPYAEQEENYEDGSI